MKLKTIVYGSLAASLLSTAAVGAEELKIWTINYTSDKQVSALTAAEAEFEKLNPGVDVQIVMRGTDEHKTALRVASGSDTGPDIYAYWAGLGLGGEYVQAGMSADLSKYYESYGWGDRLTVPSQILQLSGIGPAELLKSHGIEVLVDAPVGDNLQDHLQIRAVFKVNGTRTLNTLASNIFGKAMIGLEYLLKRSGPMSMSPSQLGAFTRSDPDRPHANLEYHVQPLSLEAFGEDLHDFPAMTVSVCNLNPTSRGQVQIRSADFRDPPKISPNYLATDEDRKIAADSLKQVRQIMAQPAMQAYQPEEYKPGVQYQSDEDLAKLAGDIASTIFHPVGTVKMGRVDDPSAVLDPHLRLKGVAGLRVVDASIMPEITSGNTNSPTLMIAEKAARWILSGQ